MDETNGTPVTPAPTTDPGVAATEPGVVGPTADSAGANLPDDDSDANLDHEQLRLAVVLNGGVSLAIWMGGATHEIDRLTKNQGAYAELLRWVQSTARVDVISGTSAGGINGAALALSQCNSRSGGMGLLRDVWLESGSIARLLRQPFKGAPPSLLQGDEFFLPELNRAMRRLAEPYQARPPREAPLDLTITATLLRGVPGVAVDASGQRISELRHDGLFRFRRGNLTVSDGEGSVRDDFSTESVATTAGHGVLDALALAARTTASFPVAFEASFLPARPEDASATGDHLHPDMSPYLSGAWDQSQEAKHSRFAVDGGVLANTPTRPALEAIDRMPAEGLVRRVMLMVHPHASAPGRDSHDDPTKVPTVAKTGGGILGALTSEGSRSFTHLIQEHNLVAASRRDLRAEVVKLALEASTGNELATQASLTYPWYLKLRARRSARALTEVWLARPRKKDDPLESFSQVYSQVLDRLTTALTPTQPEAEVMAAPHLLGYEGALGVADAAVDFLRRALRLMTVSREDSSSVTQARGVVSDARNSLLASRTEFLKKLTDLAATAASISDWLDAARAERVALIEGSALRDPLARIADAVAKVHMTHAEMETDGVQPVKAGRTLTAFADALDRRARDEAPAGEAGDVLTRLNFIQILTFVVSDDVTSGSSLPLELIQLTYQVEHPFALGLTGEDKVAGDMLSRFSAFLKRSWRINDWTWGRLDGSRVLCRTVLEPSRVAQFVAANLIDGEEFATAAHRLVAHLYTNDLDLPGVPTLEQVSDEVAALDPALEAERMRPLEFLPALFAARIALDVAAEEMPALVRAVEYDEAEGTNPRARGSINVKSNRDLLLATPTADSKGRWESLNAFGASGIGVEPINSEATSDQLIGTAATAAATAVTVLDGEGSGLGFLKPVTRTLRGGALLPYWAVNGLTGGGAVAKGLSLIALSSGAVLFALGILGIGPRWGVAVGAGAVLGAFAYGALRAGTVLHSAVLLAPAVGLLAWAAQELNSGSASPSTAGAASAPAQPTGILLSIVLMVLGLVVLGSLKPPVPSPLAWVTRHRGTAVAILLGLGLVMLIMLPSTREGVATFGSSIRKAAADAISPDALRNLGVMGAALGVLYVLLGARFAYRAGTNWRLVTLTEQPGTTQRRWQHLDVEHPAGTTAGWSWVYGMIMLLLAMSFAIAGFGGDGWDDRAALRSAVIGLAAGAALLILPVPWYVNTRASTRLRLQAQSVLARLPDNAAGTTKVSAVFGAGLNYAYLVDTTADEVDPAQPWRGVALSKHAQDAWSESR